MAWAEVKRRRARLTQEESEESPGESSAAQSVGHISNHAAIDAKGSLSSGVANSCVLIHTLQEEEEEEEEIVNENANAIRHTNANKNTNYDTIENATVSANANKGGFHVLQEEEEEEDPNKNKIVNENEISNENKTETEFPNENKTEFLNENKTKFLNENKTETKNKFPHEHEHETENKTVAGTPTNATVTAVQAHPIHHPKNRLDTVNAAPPERCQTILLQHKDKGDEDKDKDKGDAKGGEAAAKHLTCLEGPSPVATLLENLWRGVPPDAPQSAIDDTLDILGDHSRLLAAQDQLAVISKDKTVDVLFHTRIVSMVGTLSLFLDKELGYTWR